VITRLAQNRHLGLSVNGLSKYCITLKVSSEYTEKARGTNMLDELVNMLLFTDVTIVS